MTHGDNMLSVLNVGGSSKAIPIPDHYSGWDHLLLDIEPVGDPDIICDARELHLLPAAQFDAVYCSHNLEHYYRHEVPRVLSGFLHVLKPNGFAEIRVPDIRASILTMLDRNLDLEDEAYMSTAGSITFRDIVYSSAKLIEKSGSDFMAHKTGFSRKTLGDTLLAAGFADIWIMPTPPYEVWMIAFRQVPTQRQKQMLDIKD